MRHNSLFILLTLAVGLAATSAFAEGDDIWRRNGYEKISIYWTKGGKKTLLKEWYLAELGQWKLDGRAEKDPVTGQMVTWSGPRMSKLVDIALRGMNLHDRGTVDILVVRSNDGREVAVPRAVVRKYPLILALMKNGNLLESQNKPFKTIVPWTSMSSIKETPFPLNKYFVAGVKEIELANAAEKFGKFVLSKRSDPVALRGERVFRWSCMGCHETAPKKFLRDSFQITQNDAIKTKHSSIGSYMPPLSGNDVRGVNSYLDAFLREQRILNSE